MSNLDIFFSGSGLIEKLVFDAAFHPRLRKNQKTYTRKSEHDHRGVVLLKILRRNFEASVFLNIGKIGSRKIPVYRKNRNEQKTSNQNQLFSYDEAGESQNIKKVRFKTRFIPKRYKYPMPTKKSLKSKKNGILACRSGQGDSCIYFKLTKNLLKKRING